MNIIKNVVENVFWEKWKWVEFCTVCEFNFTSEESIDLAVFVGVETIESLDDVLFLSAVTMKTSVSGFDHKVATYPSGVARDKRRFWK